MPVFLTKDFSPLVAPDEQEALIRQLIDSQSPSLRRAVERVWKAQKESITRDSMVRALQGGGIPDTLVDQWRQLYSEFVVSELRPRWLAGSNFARRPLVDSLRRGLGRNPDFAAFQNAQARWLDMRGASMVRGLSSTQRQAMNAALRHFIVDEPKSPIQLARVMEDFVGLTPTQSGWVTNRRKKDVAAGLTPVQVERRSRAFAVRLQRQRAERIARTEVATAFNQGQLMTMEAARDSGDVQTAIIKEWFTSVDERVCKLCAPLHGQQAPLDETFPGWPGGELTPPRHPVCRCVVVYEVEDFPDTPPVQEPETGPEGEPLYDEDPEYITAPSRADVVQWNRQAYDRILDDENKSIIPPAGQPFDKAQFLDRHGKLVLASGTRSPRNRRARRELNHLLDMYGLANNDVEFQRPGMAGYSSGRMPRGAAAFHDWNGDIRFGRDVMRGLRDIGKNGGPRRGLGRSDRQILGVAIHEGLHGRSPWSGMRPGAWYGSSRTAKWMEEVATELPARQIVADLWGNGTPSRIGPYDRAIGAGEKALDKIFKARGVSSSSNVLRDHMTRASFRFKRLTNPHGSGASPSSFTPQEREELVLKRWAEQVDWPDEMIRDSDGSLNTEKLKEAREDLVRELKSEFERL